MWPRLGKDLGKGIGAERERVGGGWERGSKFRFIHFEPVLEIKG